MKKKVILLGVVWMLSASAFVGCGKDNETDKGSNTKTEETDAKTEKSDSNSDNADTKTQDGAELSTYQEVLDVLCESKINNDVDAFLDLFDYMRGMMKSVVTEDDYFSTIAKGYKETCGDNITWNYEITGAVKADDEDIASYQDTITTFGSSAEIGEAYNITATVHLKGDAGTKDYDLEVAVGKVGDKWQIVNFGETLLQ